MCKNGKILIKLKRELLERINDKRFGGDRVKTAVDMLKLLTEIEVKVESEAMAK